MTEKVLEVRRVDVQRTDSMLVGLLQLLGQLRRSLGNFAQIDIESRLSDNDTMLAKRAVLLKVNLN